MNQKNLFTIITTGVFFAFQLGCSHGPALKELKVLPDQGPVDLSLKPVLGYIDLTDYKSRSITKTFEEGEITKKINEAVNFTVETRVSEVDAKRKNATYTLTTTNKEGNAELSNYAMPELGQSLEIILASTGQVVRVGDIPPGTIYYVPPVSLPKAPVRVGDSWPLTSDWVSSNSGVPLRMEIVSILKSLRDCGEAGPCAEVEISGDVSLIGSKASNISPKPIDGQDIKLRYRSDIRGRLLISMAKGTVLYSVVRSDEYLNGVKDSVQIASCMMSYIKYPESEQVIKKEAIECDPAVELPAI